MAGTVLLTGLPSAGKSTLARAAAAELVASGQPAEVLDGDAVRATFWPELGFCRADRERNLERTGALAALLARNGIVAVVAAIAPFEAARRAMRAQTAGFLEVYVDTPVEVCRRRDVKGLYARAARGELAGLTGVDAPYEPPLRPDVRIDTTLDTVECGCRRIVEAVREHLLGVPNR